MEEQPLSLSIRKQAALCHLAGLLWLPISIAIFLLLPMFNQNMVLFVIAIFLFPLIGMVLATLLTILLWKANKARDPFIDRSGRSAINFILSYTLYLAIVSTLLAITCGVPMVSPEVKSIAEVLGALFPLLVAWHFCATIDRAIAARKGKVFHHPLAIKFLGEVP
jgi:uncharacterized Tic20 family protein